MTEARKTYEIGGKAFWQGPLVLGQVEYLLPIIEGLTFETGDAAALGKALGPKLYAALAVVLVEDGQTQGDLVDLLDQGKIEERAAFFRKNIAWSTAAEVVSAFFTHNPITSMPELLATLNRAVTGSLARPMMPRPSMPSSAEETSASAPVSAEQ